MSLGTPPAPCRRHTILCASRIGGGSGCVTPSLNSYRVLSLGVKTLISSLFFFVLFNRQRKKGKISFPFLFFFNVLQLLKEYLASPWSTSQKLNTGSVKNASLFPFGLPQWLGRLQSTWEKCWDAVKNPGLNIENPLTENPYCLHKRNSSLSSFVVSSLAVPQNEGRDHQVMESQTTKTFRLFFC